MSAVKGVGIGSMNNLVKERDSNGKYSDIIDFMTRLKGDVINKRQLEKLIQSGSFDSISKNRATLFLNVSSLTIYSYWFIDWSQDIDVNKINSKSFFIDIINKYYRFPEFKK